MENQFLNSIARTSTSYSQTNNTRNTKSSGTLDMNSFLILMAQQLQNQDPMNPTSQDNYMMQLAQMAVVEAMTNMTQVSISTYASSMVGKEVTVADYDSQGNIKTVTGTVTGIALYYDEPIIYIGDKGYTMSQLMSVGSVPTGEDGSGEVDPPEGGDGSGEVDPPEGGDGSGEVNPPEAGDGSGEVNPPEGEDGSTKE